MTSTASAPDAARPLYLQPAELAARIRPAVQVMNLAWGLAWLIGFGLMFARSGPGGRELVSLPRWLPLAVLGVLLVAASVITAVLGVRVFGRGDADPAVVRQAKWYGSAWLAGFLGVIASVSAITAHASARQTGLTWAVTTTALAGALLMAGSGIWQDRLMFRLGLWVTLINAAGAIAGPGWQALILSVAGGGVQVAVAACGLLRSGGRALADGS